MLTQRDPDVQLKSPVQGIRFDQTITFILCHHRRRRCTENGEDIPPADLCGDRSRKLEHLHEEFDIHHRRRHRV